MDGGTEWDAARNWLEMADREDLLELLSYLGVDMGSPPQDQLIWRGTKISCAWFSPHIDLTQWLSCSIVESMFGGTLLGLFCCFGAVWGADAKCTVGSSFGA